MGDTPQANAYIAPDVLVKLYVEDNQLVLASFPHLKKNSGLPTMMQKEALLSGITDIKLQFFLPNELQKEETDAPTNSWVDNWQRDYDCPPALVKIELTKKICRKAGVMVLYPSIY